MSLPNTQLGALPKTKLADGIATAAIGFNLPSPTVDSKLSAGEINILDDCVCHFKSSLVP